jgi:hypothetical protein
LSCDVIGYILRIKMNRRRDIKENLLLVEDRRFVKVYIEFQFDTEYLIFSLDKLHHEDTKFHNIIELFQSNIA